MKICTLFRFCTAAQKSFRSYYYKMTGKQTGDRLNPLYTPKKWTTLRFDIQIPVHIS